MHERVARIRDVDVGALAAGRRVERSERERENEERRDRSTRVPAEWKDGEGKESGERLPPSGNFCLKLEFLCGSLGLGMQIGRRRRKP